MTRAKINTMLMIEMHKMEIFKTRTGINNSNVHTDKKVKLLAEIDEFELNLDLLIESNNKLMENNNG